LVYLFINYLEIEIFEMEIINVMEFTNILSLGINGLLAELNVRQIGHYTCTVEQRTSANMQQCLDPNHVSRLYN